MMCIFVRDAARCTRIFKQRVELRILRICGASMHTKNYKILKIGFVRKEIHVLYTDMSNVQ